jgi:uncharacterized protein (TIGR04141 family)
MKLSIYLFHDGATSFDGLIQAKHLGSGGNFQKLPKPKKLSYECEAYVQSSKARPPKWLSFLDKHFDLEKHKVVNTSSSFALLLKVDDRYFAVTFGFGFNALEKSKLEPHFGLKTSLNALDPNGVRTMGSRNIDLVTRQKQTHVNVGSPAHEFDLNFNLDWVHHVAGKPLSDSIGSKVSGTDSLSITCDCDVSSLDKKCRELLKLFKSGEYKKHFAYIDYIQPLARKNPKIALLEQELARIFAGRLVDKVAIAYPRPPDEDQVAKYLLSSGRNYEDVDDITLERVYDFATKFGISDPEKIKSIGLDSNNIQVTDDWSMRDLLVCEVDQGQDSFIFSSGKWFQADRNYIQKVRDDLAKIEDLTDALKLPPIGNKPEGAYNTLVAAKKNWLNLDKKTFQIKNTYDKIEVCDLVSPDRHMICVKKMRSSATLSHLFAQGSVSAILLRQHSEYKNQINKVVAAKWPQLSLDPSSPTPPTIVYAIPTEKAGPLHKSMFFFSAINLLDHARRVRTAGLNVAVCKVNYSV